MLSQCYRSAFLIFGLASFHILLAFGQTSASSPALRIAGTVVSAASGNPLARARISIFDTRNPKDRAWMITAEDGRFEFNQLPPGKYSLQGAKRGFIRGAYDQHDEFSTAIVTGMGVETSNLVLRLVPVAQLSGKILDESGEPVRHAMVYLHREDRRAGVERIVRFRNTSTDDQGTYEFAPLDTGTYFLSVLAQPWYATHPPSSSPENANNTPVAVDKSLDVAYPVTYYADTTDADDATPIPIRGGDHAQVDIHLNPVPALHLIFHAASDGQHGFSVPVLRSPAFGGTERVPSDGVQMISPGIYEMTGVPAGRYTIQMPGTGYNENANEVDVTQDRQELDLSGGEAASKVKGTVQMLGEADIPPHLSFLLRNSKMRGVEWSDVNAKGEVEFEPLGPGKYEVLAMTPEKRYSVVSISSSGGATSGPILNVTASSPLNLLFVLIGGTVTVEGVAKRAGKTAAGAMVVLVPKDPEANHDRFRRDQSDFDGSFSLADVIPGSYTVCAIENGWDLDWVKPAVIAHYCRHGKPVIVGSKATGAVHLSDAVEVQPK